MRIKWFANIPISLLMFSQVHAQQRITIAVTDFRNLSEFKRSGLEEGFTEQMIACLDHLGYFNIVERHRLDAVMRELHLTQSDLFDPNHRIQLGKLIGADALFLGTITNYKKIQKRSYLAQAKEHISVIELSGKIVELSTGSLLFSNHIVATSSDDYSDEGGNLYQWFRLNRSKSDETALLEAEEWAVIKLATTIPQQIKPPVDHQVEPFVCVPKKSPFIAGTLSLILPGAGHIYAGRGKRGLTLAMTEIGLLGVSALLFIGAESKVDNSTVDRNSAQQSESSQGESSELKTYAWIIGGLGIGLHLFNIVDAASCANLFNERRGLSLNFQPCKAKINLSYQF